MLIRAHGPTQPPQPVMHRGDKATTFINPNTIRGVKASIKVNEVEATQCPDAGVQPTRARARFSGSFFNTGKCNPRSGQACDVAAQILIQRFSDSQDQPGILQILGEVFECIDSSCFGNRNYQPVPLGTIRVGQWATVSVEWNYVEEQFNQFIFQLGKETPQVIDLDMTVMPVASPPNSPFKQLGVSPRIPYCPSERQVGFIGADFENVFVK